LNVIGQVDLLSKLDSLLIDADVVVAGPAIVVHGIKDPRVPREAVIRISDSPRNGQSLYRTRKYFHLNTDKEA
jgi:hypothetical protein